MNVLSIILLALFCAIGGYIIGLRRGITSSQHLYDEGYVNGWDDCLKETSEADDEDNYDKARELIRQLGELFEEDEEDNIIDGGYYD